MKILEEQHGIDTRTIAALEQDLGKSANIKAQLEQLTKAVCNFLSLLILGEGFLKGWGFALPFRVRFRVREPEYFQASVTDCFLVHVAFRAQFHVGVRVRV